jgi:protein gp37
MPVLIRFVSFEPLLGNIPMYLYRASDFAWVIAGAEKIGNRPGRRAEKDWFRNIRDWCIETKTSFFLKQMQIGNKIVEMPELDDKVWNQYPNIKGAK